MASTAPIPTKVPQTYAELRHCVEGAFLRGQREIEQAKVRTYWETGWFIHEHLLFNAGRADYGAQVIPRLARDLNIAERTLYSCVHFVEYFPIPRLRAELTWGHYRLLCQVNDQGDRDALLDEAVKRHWNCADLESRVRAINAINVTPTAPATGGASPPARKPLVPNRGTPGPHQIVEKSLGPAVDLGFRHYWPLTPEQAKRFAKGDIVRIASDDSVRSVAGARKAELFTYAAQLVRVVDGDTLVVALEISPGEFLEQKLRLRGLDCPEMSTPEGKAAKRFVDALMTRTTALVINTTKPDKYDRYLADVFLIGDFSQLLAASGRSEDGSALDSHLSSEIYLNNFLLENGQAVRKDPEDFEDSWGFK